MSDLAKTLSDLRKSAGLSRRQLEIVSDVSEETIKAIEYRRNRKPTPDTLRKVATGLATNRALGRIDEQAGAEMLETLMRAAGYLPPAPPAAEVPATPNAGAAAAALAAMFRPDEAQEVADILMVWARHSEKTRRFILKTMKPLVLDVPDPE